MKASSMFKGMINDQVSPLTSALQELFVSMTDLTGRLQTANAKKHAERGIGRRLSILRVNIRHILRLTDRPKDAPLYGEAQNELGMHLNSFYIQLHGLLDNLAWLLAYELNMFGPVSEDDVAARRKVGLFLRDFRAKLTHEDTKALLERHAEWYEVTRSLRDLIAHRVPLYAVPCILSREEGERFNRLYEEELQALAAGQLECSQTLHNEKFTIGEYHPVFCQEEKGQPILAPIREQVEQDSKVVIEILWHFIENKETTQQAPGTRR